MSNVRETAAAHGFALEASSALPEIGGDAHVMRHEASGARLLYLANGDADKGFSISFKTPASDDTGVFHILEHSVLCGSEKFPVKEPFVNLLKSSMQTFLNAMTFPDKTMYPVASTNERDLMNLADVYMDAVFHPDIYRNPRIFEQEGWHLELDEGELVVNGVVFNEMKGALSDPDSVLYDTLSAALFPDTTYRFESGGTPAAIPTLTYEDFLAQHARHYRADNSYIVLYGDLDLDKFLEFLDREYLGPLAEAGAAASTLPEIGVQAPVVATGVRREMAAAPENACAAYGYVVGTAADRERIVATAVLLDSIMGSNEAPLKRALLNADIADDVDAYLADSMLQPFVMVYAKGLHEGALDKFEAALDETTRELADGGLDMALVEAALSHAEFVMRENNFGYSDGVVYSMAAMNGWLYDDAPEAATSYIRYEDVFKSLREKLSTGYFTELLREAFVDNDHWAQAEVVPVESEDDPTAARLAQLRSDMTSEDLELVERNVAELRAAQEAPDDPAALAKLPKLTKADIGRAPHEPACDVEADGVLTVLRHRLDTHGIVYATRYFDMRSVDFEELPYVTVLAMALGKMDTASHTASELDTLQQAKLGSLDFGFDIFESPTDAHSFRIKFTVGSSALSQNVEWAATLANEILTTSNFHDSERMYEILMQRKVALEQRFAMAGNAVAATRASSYYLPAGVVREQLQNIDFYIFLKRLIDEFEMRAEPLAAKLEELAARLFADDGCVLSFAGTDDDYARYMGAGTLLGIAKEAPVERLHVPEPRDAAEAFIVPADITYTALSADRRMLDIADARFTGAWTLASRILTFSYLWNEVRVMGGAYGVNFAATRPGPSAFTSYRDPHVDETLARFDHAGEWLASYEPAPDELEGYIVSTAASFDKPLKPRDLVRRQASMFFSDYPREEYLRHREEVVLATLGDVRALGPAISAIAGARHACTVGSREIIDQAAAPLNVVDLLAL